MARKRHKYTQNYPTERKDYPQSDAARIESEEEKNPAAAEQPKLQALPETKKYHPTEGNPEEGGKLSPADAERIMSEDLPMSEEQEEHRPKKAA